MPQTRTLLPDITLLLSSLNAGRREVTILTIRQGNRRTDGQATNYAAIQAAVNFSPKSFSFETHRFVAGTSIAKRSLQSIKRRDYDNGP